MRFTTALEPTERERMRQNRNALICNRVCWTVAFIAEAYLLVRLFGG